MPDTLRRYYVYSYLRPNQSPYYIGKGTGTRAWIHFTNEINPPVDLSLIKIIEEKLTEEEAFRTKEMRDHYSSLMKGKKYGPQTEEHRKNLSKSIKLSLKTRKSTGEENISV